MVGCRKAKLLELERAQLLVVWPATSLQEAPVGTLIGAAAGGVIGNRLGNYLEGEAQQAAAHAAAGAAEVPTGQRVTWQKTGTFFQTAANG